MSNTPTATAVEQRRRAITGSVVGTALEWYDFFLYGTAAALVFNKLFFPEFDPLTGTLLAFGSFAVGFIARPIGAVIFGNYGDRFGRKNVLVITLLIMGIATVLIGLVPSYGAIGIAAPIALTVLRFAQGLGLGGEWGGAVLMSLEHGDPRKRGLAASWPQIGMPLGLLMANGMIILMSAVTDEDAFLAWGWRVPFLLSAVLVMVGIWIRLRVTETPDFEKVVTAGTQIKLPIMQVLRFQKREVLTAAGARIGTDVAFYTLVLFIVTYLTQMVGVDQSVAMTAVLIGAAAMVVLIPFFGSLSDKIGRKPVYITGAAGALVWMFAFFPLLNTGDTGLIILAEVVGLIFFTAMFGPLAAFTTELFPTNVRYSGASLGFQIAGVFGGALAPIIAIALYGHFNSWLPVAVYVLAMLSITIISVVRAKETAHQHDEISKPSVEV